MSRKGGDSRKRFEDAARRLYQQSAAGQGPDISRFGVSFKGESFMVGEKRNEIVEGLTVSYFHAELDSSGRAFGNIRDVVVCTGCGCKLNIRTAKLFQCVFCKNVSCSTHAVDWSSRGVSFCKKNRICLMLGRMLQLGYYSLQSLKWCVEQVFGFEFKPHRTSLDGRRGGEIEEGDLEIVDEGDIERQLERMRELKEVVVII